MTPRDLVTLLVTGGAVWMLTVPVQCGRRGRR
jgi:hypothetical protein